MAVTRDSQSTASNAAAGTTTTWAHTVTASGGNRILVVAVMVRGGATVTSIAYNGDALSFVRRQAGGATVGVELWQLVNPDTGANNIVVTMPSAENIVCVASSYTNVDQASPLRSSGFGATATSTAPSVAVTDALTDDIVVDAVAAQGNTTNPTFTIGAGQTTNGDTASGTGTAHVVGASSSEPGAAPTMAWTLSASRVWASAAVALANNDFTGGGTVRALAGTIAGQGTAAATLALRNALAGNVAGGLTATANLTGGTSIATGGAGELRPDGELTIVVTTADGTTKTLDSNAPDPGDRPSSIQFASQQASGWTTGSFTLARTIDRDNDDIHLLDHVEILLASGDTVYEGFVAAMPRSLDDAHRLTVTLAGWMASGGDESFTEIFVDRDLNAFAGSPSTGRQAVLPANGLIPQGSTTVAPDGAGLPGVVLQQDRIANTVSPQRFAITECWYDAGAGNTIGRVYADMTSYDGGAGGAPLSGGWVVQRILTASDDGTIGADGAGNLGGTYTGYLDALDDDRRYLYLNVYFGGTATGDGHWTATWRKLAVYGDHGLPIIGDAPGGIAASDVVRYIAGRYCPLLNTSGVRDTSYPIGQLAFRDDTKPYDAWLKVNSYHLWKLAVWENRTLHFEPIDLTDWDWEIRHDEVGNTIGLQGDEYTDLRNRIRVQFQNVATGATEILTGDDYPELRDDSIDNPLNQHGRRRSGEPFVIPFPCLREDALQLGRTRLLEDNQPKAPGSFTVQGLIRDRAGILQPVSKVRAYDRIRLTSSVNLSDRPRLIGETGYNDGERITITVDGTARVLDAYIDRVSTALQAAGLT